MKRLARAAEVFAQDLRLALRSLLKRPRFTAVAVLTLAVGIGATSAVFTVVSGVLLSPLPYKDPDRLVQTFMQSAEKNYDRAAAAAPTYLDWREQNEVFEELGSYTDRDYNLTGGGLPERISGARASASIFPVLDVAPLLGRTYTDAEETEDEPVVVLSYGLWQERFGADPEILGRTVVLDDRGYSVVGVMPAAFTLGGADLWVPMVFTQWELDHRLRLFLNVLGRLKPEASLAAAQANMSALTKAIEQEYGGFVRGWGVILVPLNEQIVGNVRPTLIFLLAAVGFVLLMACVNLATLLLARANERQREFSVRLAMGGGRSHLVSQSLTESLLLALGSGVLGLLLAAVGIRWLLSLRLDIPRLDTIGIDLRVIGFTFLISLVSTVLTGLVPAIRASRANPGAELQSGGLRTTGTTRQQRRRHLLVIAQVALALVLLIGAGLTVRSFRKLMAVDPGYNPENVLITQLFLSERKYAWPEYKTAFFQGLLERAQALPGVRAAGAVWTIPIGDDYFQQNYIIEGNEAYHAENTTFTFIDAVTPDYFRAMGIPLVSGRYFTERDREEPPIAIVDETMAARWWPGEDPVGKRLVVRGVSFDYREIVGVVRNVKRQGLEAEAGPQAYVPYVQYPRDRMALIVRTEGDPLALAGPLRELIWRVDKELPMEEFSTMEWRLRLSLSQRRFNMQILGIFAFVALGLALFGIYGAVGYVVSQRTQEIGLRMALGARAAQVIKLFLGEGLAVTLTGLVLGLVAALILTRSMSGMLFGVNPLDPMTFVGTVLILAVAVLVAIYVAARKAAKVDPISALRIS